jgi:molybdopterin converting factor small subunit
MPRVVVPSQLRSYTAGNSEVDAAGATVADVLVDLDRQFPGIRFRVIDEQDRIRRHIIVFVGGDRVDSITARIPAGTELHIVGALSGG